MRGTSTLIDGRYLLTERIGMGGFSEVWRARDEVLERPVAVKLLHGGFAAHEETLHRFRAEARHAASLSHQNIARVYDYGDPSSQHPAYLVMELIEGDSLARLLERDGALDPARAMDITAQVAAGLAAAHHVGLIHRDIKPANVLLNAAGVVKITDFGIAYTAGSAPLTQTGMIFGTPSYLAPERASGVQASEATDLYALGVVIYECLTGTPPFGGTAIEVALAHRERRFPPLPASVPDDVARLVADLTAKHPAHRPASAAEVATRAAELRNQLGAAGRGTATWPRLDLPESGVVQRPAAMTQMFSSQPEFSSQRAARRRPSWPLLVGAVAVGVAATLIAVVGANLLGASGPAHPSNPAGATSPVTAAWVNVDSAALVGKSVAVASSQLQADGLVVRVRWQQTDGQPAGAQPPDGQQTGRVVSIQPTGRVKVGSTVTIIAQPGHHDHGQGHDNGNGNGGDGGGGGG